MIINVQPRKESVVKKSDKELIAPLIFTFYYLKKRYRVPVGEKVNTLYWDSDLQKLSRKEPLFSIKNRSINKRKEILYTAIFNIENSTDEFNRQNVKNEYQRLVKVEYGIKEAKVNMLQSETPADKELVFEALDKFLNRRKADPVINFPKNTFFQSCGHYILYSKNTHSTKRKLKRVIRNLLNFDSNFDLPKLTEDFYNSFFLDYLVNIPLADNYIDLHIQELKKMATYTSKRIGLLDTPEGYKIPEDYIEYKRIYQNPSRVALSWEEVQRIESFETDDPELITARDGFLVACYTGLRFQNVAALEDHSFFQRDGHYYLRVVTFKNSKFLEFQLSPKVKSIIDQFRLNRYNKKLYNHEINDALHVVAKEAGLTDIIYDTKLYGGKPVTTPMQKWEKVTMHVGRHTFACEFLRRNKSEGLNALKALSELLNHSSTKTTEIYWNMISSERNQMLVNTF